MYRLYSAWRVTTQNVNNNIMQDDNVIQFDVDKNLLFFVLYRIFDFLKKDVIIFADFVVIHFFFKISTLQSRLDHCVHQTLTANITTMHHLTGRSIVTIFTHISADVKLEQVNTSPIYFL